jgi:SAM-dependent methyltransferase
VVQIDLNELPSLGPWPTRLLGLSPWNIPRRTVDKVEQEYNKDKYARCLEYYTQATSQLSPEQMKQFELEYTPDSDWNISIHNDIFRTTFADARKRHYDLLIQHLTKAISQSATVVELGCGYGYNLWMLQNHFRTNCHWLGGEYSTNAVSLANKLYADNPNLNVTTFNFYDEIYTLLQQVPPPITIYTMHALEQIPDAAHIIQTLMENRDIIHSVFHFEPIYELHDDSLMGLMRRRYTEMNDYNTNLLTQLKQNDQHIQIEHTSSDVFGLSPFNPTSIVEWRPKQ